MQDDTYRAKSSKGALETEINSKYASNARMEVYAEYQHQLEIAEAMMWLCSAIRSSPIGLCLSTSDIMYTMSYTNTEKPLQSAIDIKAADSRAIDDASSPCWHALFASQAVAEGFQIPKRNGGKGLETSFEIIAALSQSLNFIEIDDGLVAEGLTTVLIPVAKLGQGKYNAVQWHLEVKPPVVWPTQKSAFHILTPQLFEAMRPEKWYRERDPSLLTTAQAFLGWVPEALTLAGTSKANLAVETSGLPQMNDTVRTWGQEGNIGLQFPPLMFSGTFTTAFSSITSSIRNEEALILDLTLENAKGHHAILYDNDAKTGWQISHANLILYLAHILASHRQSCLAKWNLHALCKPEPVLNDGEITVAALRSEQFYWLFRHICYSLAKVEEGIQKTRMERRKTKKITNSKSLIGVELLDVALFESRVPCKEVKIQQLWIRLAEEEPLVLFCKNLGQVIIPASQGGAKSGLCPEFEKVPEGKNFLVAKTDMVDRILDKNTSEGIPRLGTSIRWKFDRDKPLFALHEYEVHTLCHHIQRLAFENPSKDQIPLKDMVKQNLNGALIFGGTGTPSLTREKYCTVQLREVCMKSLRCPQNLLTLNFCTENLGARPWLYTVCRWLSRCRFKEHE